MNSLLKYNVAVDGALDAYIGSFLFDALSINFLQNVQKKAVENRGISRLGGDLGFFPESVQNIINRFQFDYYYTNTLSVSFKYTSFFINTKKETYDFLNHYDRIDICFNYDFTLE